MSGNGGPGPSPSTLGGTAGSLTGSTIGNTSQYLHSKSFHNSLDYTQPRDTYAAHQDPRQISRGSSTVDDRWNVERTHQAIPTKTDLYGWNRNALMTEVNRVDMNQDPRSVPPTQFSKSVSSNIDGSEFQQRGNYLSSSVATAGKAVSESVPKVGATGGALSGAASAAGAGALVGGPVGAAIGAVAGAAVGVLSGAAASSGGDKTESLQSKDWLGNTTSGEYRGTFENLPGTASRGVGSEQHPDQSHLHTSSGAGSSDHYRGNFDSSVTTGRGTGSGQWDGGRSRHLSSTMQQRRAGRWNGLGAADEPAEVGLTGLREGSMPVGRDGMGVLDHGIGFNDPAMQSVL